MFAFLDAVGGTAYSTGDARRHLEQAGHRLFCKPVPLLPSPAASPSTPAPAP